MIQFVHRNGVETNASSRHQGKWRIRRAILLETIPMPSFFLCVFSPNCTFPWRPRRRPCPCTSHSSLLAYYHPQPGKRGRRTKAVHDSGTSRARQCRATGKKGFLPPCQAAGSPFGEPKTHSRSLRGAQMLAATTEVELSGLIANRNCLADSLKSEEYTNTRRD